MRKGLSAIVAAAAAATMIGLSWAPASAQQNGNEGKKVRYPGAVRPTKAPPPGPPGPVPRMPGGKPDLSGVWNAQRELPGDQEPEMSPWAAALTKQRTENYSADDPEARCVPDAAPTSAEPVCVAAGSMGIALLQRAWGLWLVGA